MGLEQAIIDRLGEVMDPETGVDVLRMRLIENLRVDEENGFVSFKFRPSSPLCPLAVHLALTIREAVGGIPGVNKQDVEVINYVRADELNALLRQPT